MYAAPRSTGPECTTTRNKNPVNDRMPLNLITDPWIPVVRHGVKAAICPHEMAADGIERLDWPRGDLNLACLEFLIGLIFLADPPRDDSDWHERYSNPDPDRMRDAFEPFSPHFELTGDGPRFLQDLEPLEVNANKDKIKPPDVLFIDSAGDNTAKKNTDLMVKRNRYQELDLSLAAMSLYTLQAFAPTGGSGMLTSMRGGGPMVTLMKPLDGGTQPLWRLVWSNVPEGKPLYPDDADQALPWLRPTRTSEKKQVVTPDMSHPAEAFFGMPRRIRLMFKGDTVTGVVQKGHGARYEGWTHPLSPYHCKNVGGERLAVHPKPGRISYQHWLGLLFGEDRENQFMAKTVRRFHKLVDRPDAELHAGGWAMKKWIPQDFTLHAYPTFRLDNDMEMRVRQLVEAANSVVGVLANSLAKSMEKDGALQGKAKDTRKAKNAKVAVEEAFFTDTEQEFVCAVQAVADNQGLDVEESWIRNLRQAALSIFDRHTLSTLSNRNVTDIEKTFEARSQLLAHFSKKSGVHKIFPDLPAAGSNPT